LNTKRPVLLSDETSQGLPEEVDKEARGNQKQKLGSELPIFDDILVICTLLGPGLDNCITYETHETFDGEENQKSKKDIVEGLHLLII
jgi:hypothetical protein